MNEPGVARQFFFKGAAKPTCILKAVSAAVTIFALIMAFASGISSMGSSLIGAPSGMGAAAVGGSILTLLPIFVLIGMGILWAVAFSRASTYEADGSLMRSSAAASTALSSVAFTAGVAITIILIGAASASRGSSFMMFSGSSDALSIIALIVTGIGVLCLLPTAISRMIFYRNVQKSMNNQLVRTGGATFYAVMKIINVLVKVGYAVVILITMIRTKGAPATAVIFFISAILALLVGAVANITEAVMAFKYKKCDPAGGQYYQDNYRQPYYPAPEQPAPNYAAPNYAAPDYTAPDYAAPKPQQQAATIYCPNCGTPNQGGSVFCESCGTKLL